MQSRSPSYVQIQLLGYIGSYPVLALSMAPFSHYIIPIWLVHMNRAEQWAGIAVRLRWQLSNRLEMCCFSPVQPAVKNSGRNCDSRNRLRFSPEHAAGLTEYTMEKVVDANLPTFVEIVTCRSRQPRRRIILLPNLSSASVQWFYGDDC